MIGSIWTYSSSWVWMDKTQAFSFQTSKWEFRTYLNGEPGTGLSSKHWVFGFLGLLSPQILNLASRKGCFFPFSLILPSPLGSSYILSQGWIKGLGLFGIPSKSFLARRFSTAQTRSFIQLRPGILFHGSLKEERACGTFRATKEDRYSPEL